MLNGLELIKVKVITPPKPVSPVKGYTIIAELADSRGELRNPLNIVTARQHPQAFHQVEKGVGVTGLVEQHTLPGALVSGGYRPAHGKHLTHPRRLSKAVRQQHTHPYGKGIVDVTCVYRSH